jgi:DNA phosphorothioation-dependent restriction protein DptG
VVHQLVKRESGGSLIRSHGNRVTFFELDEEFLFLLVKLVCKDQEVPFDDFLVGLYSYGLTPQDDAERQRLAEALERLGMLTRYSDAGESTYVKHPL